MKRNTLNKILVLVMFGLILGCSEKEPLYPDNYCDSDCITFEGQVIDRNNNKAVDSVKITVKYDDGLILSDIIELGTTYTDSQGDFTYSFPGSELNLEKGKFIIKATKSGYLENSQIGMKNLDSSDSIRLNETKRVDFDFFPLAYIKIKVSLKNLQNISSFTYGFNHCEFDYGYGFDFYPPTFTEKTFKHEVMGDGCLHVGYSGISSNGKFSKGEDIYINKGDTEIYEIIIE